MVSRQSQKRLAKEYKSITANPPAFIVAKPNDENILEWHFVITGPPETPYDGGQYHGMLRFPSDYPFKPPSISMITPNGRFACNTRLCLSMSDYHPDTWNPAWSVATIITGLLSFMTGDEATTGSIKTSDVTKRRLAEESKKWNTTENQRFIKQYPSLTEENKKELHEKELLRKQLELVADNKRAEAARSGGTSDPVAPSSSGTGSAGGQENVMDIELLDPEDRARLVVEHDDSEHNFWVRRYTIIGVLLAGILAATFNIFRR